MLSIPILFPIFLTSAVVKSVPLTSDYDTFLNDAVSTGNEFLASSSIAPEETLFGIGPDTVSPTLDLTTTDLELLSPESQGLNPLNAFTDPQINPADSDLFDGSAISFSNGFVTPDAGTSAFTSPEDSIVNNINWGDYAFESGKDLVSLSPNPTPPAFPSICSMFRYVNSDDATITSYEATYGEGGIQDGKIIGYSTAWHRGYIGSECGQPTSWYCCLDPANGEDCMRVIDFYPDATTGSDDACQR